MICPQTFCFFWNEAGDQIAPGMHPSLEEAMHHLVLVEKSGCGFRYGQCRRAGSLEGVAAADAKDFYEPCEPHLRKAGLPDFYFNDPNKLKTEAEKAEYWGYFGEQI